MMRPKTTPDEPGFPPRHSFASFMGRGFWLGLLTVIITAILAWLFIRWMMS